jgi:signal transduction histidine kinase/CheY-like chemotaxis protein
MSQIKFNKKFNSIENKQLALFTLSLAILSLFNIIGNILLKLSFELNLLVFIVLLLHLTIFILIRKDKLTDKLKYYYFNFISVCLLLSWIFNGGLDSSTPIYFLLYLTVGILSNAAKYLKMYIIYFCIICAICLFIEFFYKDIIHDYPNAQAKFLDLLLTFSVVTTVSLILLISYKKVFMLERNALLNKALRLQNSQKELIATKDIALNAVKAKANFLSNMSHEVRTPLNGIIGTLDLLKNTDLSDEQKSLIKNLTVSSNVLIDLVNDILDISKIEANKLILKPKSFNILETLQTLETLTNTLIKDKDIVLNFNISSHVPEYIICDETKLKQILINLLSNANKFTTRGSIDVFTDYDNQSKLLEIRIRDTGIGIKEEDYNKLFLPFSQIDNENNNPYGGVGLGLLISSKLTEFLGGTISVESYFGKGSVFYIKIPVNIAVNKTLNNDTIEELNISDKEINNLDILIVEDNQINQIIMSKMLKSFDCYFSLANNGQEAVDLVKNQSFDIILMDVQMPVKDGITATKEIIDYFKGNGNKCPIIIGCTANAMQEDKNNCLEAGMHDVIVKPIKLEMLKERLQKWA